MDTVRSGNDRNQPHVERRNFLKLCLGVAGRARLATGGAGVAGLLASASRITPVRAQESEVTIAMPRPIRAIDARRHVSTEEQQPFVHLYDGLVWLDETLTVQPALAESWERVDSSTWRFKLRQGVKFHNGDDFTAESVKFSFDQYANLDPEYNYAYLWEAAWPPTVEIEAPDIVTIHTPAPSPILLRWITRIGMMPQAATDPGYGEAPIGTGPFRFVDWQLGEYVSVEAFDGYWNGAPKINRLTWRTIPDAASRLAALQAGEIDLAWDVPPDRLGELTAPEFSVIDEPTSQIGTVPFNFRNPDAPIADVRVRRALTQAIDGPGMIEALLGGKAIQSKGLAPQAVYASADTGGYPARDVDGARALLAEAGYPDGIELNVMFSPGEFPQDTTIIEAIIGQLSEVGVSVNLEELDGAEYLERKDTLDWDITNDGAGAWMGDAQFFASAVSNVPGYVSPEADALIAESAEVAEEERRVELLQEAQQILWDAVPFLWSFDRVSMHGLNNRVVGAQFIPTNRVAFHRAEIAG